MSKRLKDIKFSTDPRDIRSRDRLKKNLERKFKKVMGATLYHFEVLLRDVLNGDEQIHKEFRSELFRIGNRMIQNMKKELDCYNITYVPVTMEMKGPESNEG